VKGQAPRWNFSQFFHSHIGNLVLGKDITSSLSKGHAIAVKAQDPKEKVVGYFI
jgi:hypothetical protein